MSIPLTKAITFRNRDGYELSARLEFPADGHAKAFALFAHCFTCGKDLKVIRNISRSMTSAGFGVMVFDFTGLGSSEGSFEETGFHSNVDDLVDAVDYLRENGHNLAILLGHSMGGAAALCVNNYSFWVVCIRYARASSYEHQYASPSHVQRQRVVRSVRRLSYYHIINAVE